MDRYDQLMLPVIEHALLGPVAPCPCQRPIGDTGVVVTGEGLEYMILCHHDCLEVIEE